MHARAIPNQADLSDLNDVGPLPTRLQEISIDLLNKGLAHSFPGAVIKGFRLEEVHHGFSTVIRVHLEPDSTSRAANLPPSIILKGGFEEATRKRGRDYTYMSLEMEYQAYKLLPTLGLHMPQVFFLALDPVRLQMIILMEDLLLRKVNFGHGLKPYSPAQVSRRLTTLAAFHARTWDSPELKTESRYGVLPKNGAAMFVGYIEHAGYDEATWDRYIAMPRGMACPVKFHDRDWMIRSLNYAAALSDSLPNCVVHGDTHLGNVFEELDGTPGFFDSLPRREAGMMETTYHICNALDPVDRRKHDRDLIAHYRGELSRHGIKVRSLNDMMHEFATYLTINYVTFIVNEPTYQSESFNTVHAVRAAIAMMDHNTYDIV